LCNRRADEYTRNSEEIRAQLVCLSARKDNAAASDLEHENVSEQRRREDTKTMERDERDGGDGRDGTTGAMARRAR
jgi:hypothetical protein